MSRCGKYLVVGDIHGEFKYLKALIAEQKPKAVFSTGDFGYWPRFMEFTYEWEDNETPIYFCEGNHEDFEALLPLKCNEVARNVLHMKRGSTLELEDGRTVMFMGGAQSIDRFERTLGLDYFHEEIITYGDYYRLDDSKKVDIIISHTKPNYFNVGIPKWEQDPSENILDAVFDLYKPERWYFSHWHKQATGEYAGCKWSLLNQAPEFGWWKWLE